MANEAFMSAQISSRRKRMHRIVGGLLVALLLLAAAVLLPSFHYAYVPDAEHTIAYEPRNLTPYFDRWGEKLPQVSADELAREPRPYVEVNDAFIKQGRKAFYEASFGNEVFLTDVLGITSGPLPLWQYTKAILALRGQPTTNLQVELAEPIDIAGRHYAKGEKIDTGLDVPKGALMPLGLVLGYSHGKVRSGVSCALCHSSVDPVSGKVLEGVTNTDLRIGMILAMSSNPNAFFAHGGVDKLAPFIKSGAPTVPTSDGSHAALPDPAALSAALRATFSQWPPGAFDSTLDVQSNPTRIPPCFTADSYPYAWTGTTTVGPFHGLSALNNNVHSVNSDATGFMELSQVVFGLDKELYLAIVLRGAASAHYRYDPASGKKPSDFFHQAEQAPDAPGMNQTVALPTYPKASVFAVNSLLVTEPGHRVGETVNAIAAFENTISPPRPPEPAPSEAVRLMGQSVFSRAGCASCHSGVTYTNHRVIPVEEIGTEPSRAKALSKLETILSPPRVQSFSAVAPVKPGTAEQEIPVNQVDPAQLQLSFALNGLAGGYKVLALLGLRWSAPYLHDGGIAMGSDVNTDCGVPGTLGRGVMPDPANSLRALVDRDLRARVLAANAGDPNLRRLHVSGAGHEFWVDAAAGYSSEEQAALVAYLLDLSPTGNGQ